MYYQTRYTSAFSISTRDNPQLNFQYDNPAGVKRGWCVFGRVVSGWDVVEKLKGIQTRQKGDPVIPPVIKKAQAVKPIMKSSK